MKDFDATTDAYIGGRTDIVARHLLWFQARNRSNNQVETAGLWTGIDAQVFIVDGEERTYYGAGAVMSIEPLTTGLGLEVRILQIRLSDLTPEVAQLIRGYDARFAPVTIHRVLLDHSTRQPVAAPIRVFRGWVDELTIRTGRSHQVDVRLASDARRLTRSLSLFRSDAAMRARSATDRFREYVDVAGRIPVWWGTTRNAGDRS